MSQKAIIWESFINAVDVAWETEQEEDEKRSCYIDVLHVDNTLVCCVLDCQQPLWELKVPWAQVSQT